MVFYIPIILTLIGIAISSQSPLEKFEFSLEQEEQPQTRAKETHEGNNINNLNQQNDQQAPIDNPKEIDSNASVLKKAILRMCAVPKQCIEIDNTYLPLICDSCEKIRKVKAKKESQTITGRKSHARVADSLEIANEVDYILDQTLEKLKLTLDQSDGSRKRKTELDHENPQDNIRLLQQLVKIVLKSKSKCDCNSNSSPADILLELPGILRCACHKKDIDIPEVLSKLSAHSNLGLSQNLEAESTRSENSNGLISSLVAELSRNNARLTNNRSLRDAIRKILNRDLQKRNKKDKTTNSIPDILQVLGFRNIKGIYQTKSKQLTVADNLLGDSVEVDRLLESSKAYNNNENVLSTNDYSKELLSPDILRACGGPPGASCPGTAKYYKKKKARKSKAYARTIDELLQKILDESEESNNPEDYTRCGCGKRPSINDEDNTNTVNILRNLVEEQKKGNKEERAIRQILRDCGGPPGYTSCPIVAKYYVKKRIRKNKNVYARTRDDSKDKQQDDSEDEMNAKEFLRCGCGKRPSIDENEYLRCGCGKRPSIDENENEYLRCGCGKRPSIDENENEYLRCGCGKRPSINEENSGNIVDVLRSIIGKKNKEMLRAKKFLRGCGGPPGYTSCPMVAKYYKKKRARKNKNIYARAALAAIGEELEDSEESTNPDEYSRCGCGKRPSIDENENEYLRCGCGKRPSIDENENEYLRCGCGKRPSIDENDSEYLRCGCGKRPSINEEDSGNIVDVLRSIIGKKNKEMPRAKKFLRGCGGPPGYTSCPMVAKYYKKKRARKNKNIYARTALAAIGEELEGSEESTNPDEYSRCGCSGNKGYQENEEIFNSPDIVTKLSEVLRCGCKGKRQAEDEILKLLRCGCKGKKNIEQDLRCGCSGKRGFKDNDDSPTSNTRCGQNENSCSASDIVEQISEVLRCGCKGKRQAEDEILELLKCGCKGRKSVEGSDIIKDNTRCGNKRVENSDDIASNDPALRCGCGSKNIQNLEEKDIQNIARCRCGSKVLRNNNVLNILTNTRQIDTLTGREHQKRNAKKGPIDTLTGRYKYISRCGCGHRVEDTSREYTKTSPLLDKILMRETRDTFSDSDINSDSDERDLSEDNMGLSIEDYKTVILNKTRENPKVKTLRLPDPKSPLQVSLNKYLKYLAKHVQKYRINDELDAVIVNVPEFKIDSSHGIPIKSERDYSNNDNSLNYYRLKKKAKQDIALQNLQKKFNKLERKRKNNILDWLHEMYNSKPNNEIQNKISVQENDVNDISNLLDDWSKIDGGKYERIGTKDKNGHSSIDELIKTQRINGQALQSLFEGVPTHDRNVPYDNNKKNTGNINLHLKSSDDSSIKNRNTVKNEFNEENRDNVGQAFLEAIGWNSGAISGKKTKTYKKMRNTLDENFIVQQLLHQLKNSLNENNNRKENQKVQLKEIPQDVLAYINELQIARNDLVKSKRQLYGKSFDFEQSGNEYREVNNNINFIERLLNKLKSQFNLSKDVQAVLIDAKDLEGLGQRHSEDESFESDNYKRTKVILEPSRAGDDAHETDNQNTSETTAPKTETELIKQALISDVLDYVKRKRTKIPTFLNKKQRNFVKKLTNKKTQDYSFSDQELEQQIEDLLFGEVQERASKLKMKKMRQEQKKALAQQQKEQRLKEQQDNDKSYELFTRSIVSPLEQLKKRKTKALIGINQAPPRQRGKKSLRRSNGMSQENQNGFGVPFEMDLDMLAQVN